MSANYRELLPIGLAAVVALAIPIIVLWPTTPFVDPPVSPSPRALPVTELVAVDAILARPLFSENRLPPPAPDPLGAGDAQALVQSPPPQLVGTIAGRGGGIALLKVANGETATLAIGMSVDGWRLLSVGNGRAEVAQGDRRESVELDLKNKPTADGAASGAAAATPGSSDANTVLTRQSNASSQGPSE